MRWFYQVCILALTIDIILFQGKDEYYSPREADTTRYRGGICKPAIKEFHTKIRNNCYLKYGYQSIY